MKNCKRCGRPLICVKSVAKEYGPTCKKKQDVADAEFLKIQITIFEEIDYQEKVRQ